jgi:predicted MFS family arabinose efflux permease
LSSVEAGPARWREVFAGARGRLTAGLLVLEAVAGVEALVVATILPAVRRDLGDIQYYGWTFSAFSLAAFATIPIAGRAIDRLGPRRPLAVMLGLFAIGLAVAAVAPSMLVLVLGRFIQGIGAGGAYSVSLGAVAKAYPDRYQPRVLALLASMWILPGLLGPPLGAFLAGTIGWRWAFLAPLPALAGATILVLPALGPKVTEPSDVAEIALRWPIQLMVGAGMVLAGLADPSLWSVPLLVFGLAAGLPALAKIVPPGTFRAARGLPATAAAAFMLSAGFFAVDGFLPLMLTALRGMSVGHAGLVITAATLSWAAGSWWQSRRATSWSLARLVTLGAQFVLVGTLAVGAGLHPAVPAIVVYLGWLVAGTGMGIAFPTIPLTVMRESAKGEQAGQLSSTLLMDVLGVGIGAGLSGSSIAVSRAAGLDLRAGLVGAFAISALSMILLMAIARRLPAARTPVAG